MMATTRLIMNIPPCGKGQLGIEEAAKERVAILAKSELRETKSARDHGVEQIKQWIEKNRDIKNVRTDEQFILRFLRAKKFSVPMTQQMILKWLNLRKTFPDMCKGLDCLQENVKQIIDDGYLVVSPCRDRNGRRVIFYNVKKFNALKYTSSDMARVHFLAYETLLEDDDDQVLGFTHVADIDGLSTNHITSWSPSTFARILRHGEQSTPMRHKEIHLLNVSKTVKYVYDFAKTKMSPKINGRMSVHSSVQSLHSMIGSSCLPKEYGGVIAMDEMITKWKKELLYKRSVITSLDEMDIVNIKCLTPVKNSNDENNNNKTNYYSLPGSFRKLEVD